MFPMLCEAAEGIDVVGMTTTAFTSAASDILKVIAVVLPLGLGIFALMRSVVVGKKAFSKATNG